jgi:hypothetical protein
LTLDREQEFTLLEGCEIDQVQTLLRENLPEQLSKISVPEQHKFVSQAISLAKQNGLESVLQFSIYTAAILSYGERATKDPLWIKFVDELRGGDFDSNGALSKMNFNEI